MKGIAEYLKKFADFAPPERAAQRAVVRAIGERFTVAVSEKEITMRDGGAYVRGSGALKSEIAIHKEALLSRVRELLGSSTVRDLR